jgi:DNA-binding LacI/PurR family transcriptional regulator
VAVTLRDVANRCGVSPSTVSDILNNRSRTWASEETRRRVFEAAADLGYRPNAAARALRTGKTNAVALVHHREGLPRVFHYDGAAEVLASVLGDYGYILHLHAYLDQRQLMEGLSDMTRRRTVDAVVLLNREEDATEQGKLLADSGIPFVAKGRLEAEAPDWYQVDYDHEAMMDSAVAALVEMGHRRLAYIGWREDATHRRLLAHGFREAHARRLGSPPDPRRLSFVDGTPGAFVARLVDSWMSEPEAHRPTGAVIGALDSEWRALEQSLAYYGVRVGFSPGEFGVCGQSTASLWLNYGSGLRFRDISYVPLVEAAARDLLLPLLKGEHPPDKIIRLTPPLETTVSQVMELPAPR